MKLSQQELQLRLIENQLQPLGLSLEQAEHMVIMLDMVDRPTAPGQISTHTITDAEAQALDMQPFEIRLEAEEHEGQLIWYFVL